LEGFRAAMRRDLPATIGLPLFPPLGQSVLRGRVRVGENLVCERIGVQVDPDYAIPSFAFLPLELSADRLPALVWSGGWPHDKFMPTAQLVAARISGRGLTVMLFDHGPFGVTTPPGSRRRSG
jgi:hypothetical protein